MERIEKLKQFLESNPGDAFVLHALALEYVKSGDEVKAEQYFSTIITDHPENTGTYYHLAKLMERSGRTEEALDIYQKGIVACKKMNDDHALRELQMAYEDLLY